MGKSLITSFCSLLFLIAFFSYVHAQSSLVGDANADNTVNGTDYVIWLNNYDSISPSGPSSGDFNNDNKVNGNDYVLWLNNYGVTVSSYPKTYSSNSSAVTFVETKAPEGNKVFIEARSPLANIYRVNFYINNILQNTDSTAPYFLGGDSNGVQNGFTLSSSPVQIKVSVGQDDGTNQTFTNAEFTYTLNGNVATATPAPTSSPTPTASSTPTPSPTGSASNKLTWSPPQLVNPITITLGTGGTSNTLDDTKDYIIKLPTSKKTGGTTIQGGRNIHVIGGHITLAPPYPPTQRALYFKDNGGEIDGRVIHVEGVLFDGSGGGMGDAIVFDADTAIAQIQNIRAVNLKGGQDTAIYDHTDLIQPFGGVKELRVDKFTGSTNYQGMQVPIDLGPIEKTDLRRVDVSYAPQSPNDGGYLMWFLHTQGGDVLAPCSTGDYYPINLQEVYVHNLKSGRTLGNSVYPEERNTHCGARVSNNFATWPQVPQITGGVRLGLPPGGEYVPAGVAGVNYQSPGYQ